MTRRVINNHFVAQCYQKNWQIPDPKRRKWIGIYRRDGTYTERAIKRNASRDYFYAQELEDELGRVESNYAAAVRKVLSKSPLLEPERKAIVRYAATQFRRNVVGYTRAERLLNQQIAVQQCAKIAELMQHALWTSETFLEGLVTAVAYQYIAEDVYRRLGSGGVREDIFTGITLRELDQFEQILRSLTWYFYISGGTREFVTSDNPLILPTEGLANKPEVIFPIAPKICLVAKRGPGACEIFATVPDKRVARLNERIIAAASQEVYCTRPVLSAKLLKKMGTQIWGQNLRPLAQEGEDFRNLGAAMTSGGNLRISQAIVGPYWPYTLPLTDSGWRSHILPGDHAQLLSDGVQRRG